MNGFQIIEQFPCIITPINHDISFQELTLQLKAYKKTLEQLLLKKGGLLFRGFPIHTADDFSDFIEALGLGQFVNYIGGDSPRDKVKNKVYTSTEAPPNFHIALHQEMSFIKHFPKHIYFFCEIAPQIGGETIIADAREVYSALDDNIKVRFHSKSLTYTSHYFYKNKIMEWVNRIQRSHKSWPEVFETSNKDEVEQRCQENEFEWQWLHQDWLELKQTRPALLEHPITKETVWFNQAHLYDFNPKLLGWKNYIATKLFYFKKSIRLHEISFADGTSVPRRDLYHILDTLNAKTVAFPWHKKDVMVLDNILAMHGRAPYKGPRRILTALTK